MVNCINGTSGTGKTRKLLEYAKQENAIVICQNAAAMQRKALMGLLALKFMIIITPRIFL